MWLHDRPLDHEERAALNFPYYLADAQKTEREHPELFGALGVTPEQYAHEMTEPGKSLQESVEAGWISAAEARRMQGQATLDDLLEIGYSAEEADAILSDQRERACASST